MSLEKLLAMAEGKEVIKNAFQDAHLDKLGRRQFGQGA